MLSTRIATRRILSLKSSALCLSSRKQSNSSSGAKAFQPPAPAPPQLSPKEQKEWNALQKQAEQTSQQVFFHPDVRRKPKPEFEGDRNPTTGETGGPKNDPLRHGDYAYGGRVTDF